MLYLVKLNYIKINNLIDVGYPLFASEFFITYMEEYILFIMI